MNYSENNTRDFEIKKTKTGKVRGEVPIYKLTDRRVEKVGVLEIPMLSFEGQGVMVENVLSLWIARLGELNVGHLRSRETAVAITKLQEALMWIEERKRDRIKRKVIGTMNK